MRVLTRVSLGFFKHNSTLTKNHNDTHSWSNLLLRPTLTSSTISQTSWKDAYAKWLSEKRPPLPIFSLAKAADILEYIKNWDVLKELRLLSLRASAFFLFPLPPKLSSPSILRENQNTPFIQISPKNPFCKFPSSLQYLPLFCCALKRSYENTPLPPSLTLFSSSKQSCKPFFPYI